MPAVVSRTDGSNAAGTSDADGSRLWSRAAKNSRKVSRIWSDVTRPSLKPAWRRLGHHDRVAGQRGAPAGPALVHAGEGGRVQAVGGDGHCHVRGSAAGQRLAGGDDHELVAL